MKSIQFNATVPRYIAGKLLGGLFPSVLWSGLSCTYLAEAPEAPLPGADWVRVRTRYGGICGTDMNTILLRGSPYFSVLASFPSIIGHEGTGSLVEVGAGAGPRTAGAGPRTAGVNCWQAGERVVVEPLLWCRQRGFADLCPACARGAVNLCERQTEGALAAGLFTGYNRDVSGSWAPSFLAHAAQLYRVPAGVSDENALMVEPFATGLHAALGNFPSDDETVLIIGAGSIGLCTLAALRVLGSQARILVLARYAFQAEAARKLGASEVISAGRGSDYYAEFARLTGARVVRPIIGKQVVLGGVQRTFDCVGSSISADDALRFTRPGGTVVLVAAPGMASGVDWSAPFSKELDLRFSFAYSHAEPYQQRTWEAFDLILHLMESGRLDLGWMVTHRFRLEEYRRALEMSSHHGRHRIIKAAFEFPAGV